MEAIRVAIIGGGPGGLMAAHLLQKRSRHPCEITLFEAGSRLGGKILTPQFSVAPVYYEAGAAELYDYSQVGPDPLRELVAELGLSTRPINGKAVVMDDVVLRDANDVRRHFGPATHDALREFGRRARELVSPQDYYESDWKADNQDPLSRQRFSELLATVSDPAARRYISVSIHSDLATEPHQTNAMYGLQNFLMNEPGYMQLYSIDGGIEGLTRELTRRISARVLLGHRVLRVEKTRDDMYQVRARHEGRVVDEAFDFVVAALPNNWLPAIEWAGDALSRAMDAHHTHYDYPAHYLRASVLFKEPFWRRVIEGSYFMLDDFGGCCVYDETSRATGADGTPYGVLGWLLGGEAALTMNNLDDAALVARVLDSLPSCLAHGREMMLEARVHRWTGAVNGLPAGYPAREPDSRHLPEPEGHPGLFVVGDYLFDSTLNGVLDSADTVVEWILEEMEDDANV
jgi:monoamine oxidase